MSKVDNNEIVIEFESVKKSKKLIFFGVMGLLIMTTILFLVLYIVKPGGGISPVKGMNLTNNLFVDSVDASGNKIYSASIGNNNVYTINANLNVTGNIEPIVVWDVAPAGIINIIESNNKKMDFSILPSSTDAQEVTITATSGGIVQAFKFVVRENYASTALFSGVQSRYSDDSSAKFTAIKDPENDRKYKTTIPFFKENTALNQYKITASQLGKLDSNNKYAEITSGKMSSDGINFTNALSFSVPKEYEKAITIDSYTQEYVLISINTEGKAFLNLNLNGYTENSSYEPFTVELEIVANKDTGKFLSSIGFKDQFYDIFIGDMYGEDHFQLTRDKVKFSNDAPVGTNWSYEIFESDALGNQIALDKALLKTQRTTDNTYRIGSKDNREVGVAHITIRDTTLGGYKVFSTINVNVLSNIVDVKTNGDIKNSQKSLYNSQKNNLTIRYDLNNSAKKELNITNTRPKLLISFGDAADSSYAPPIGGIPDEDIENHIIIEGMEYSSEYSSYIYEPKDFMFADNFSKASFNVSIKVGKKVTSGKTFKISFNVLPQTNNSKTHPPFASAVLDVNVLEMVMDAKLKTSVSSEIINTSETGVRYFVDAENNKIAHIYLPTSTSGAHSSFSILDLIDFFNSNGNKITVNASNAKQFTETTESSTIGTLLSSEYKIKMHGTETVAEIKLGIKDIDNIVKEACVFKIHYETAIKSISVDSSDSGAVKIYYLVGQDGIIITDSKGVVSENNAINFNQLIHTVNYNNMDSASTDRNINLSYAYITRKDGKMLYFHNYEEHRYFYLNKADYLAKDTQKALFTVNIKTQNVKINTDIFAVYISSGDDINSFRILYSAVPLEIDSLAVETTPGVPKVIAKKEYIDINGKTKNTIGLGVADKDGKIDYLTLGNLTTYRQYSVVRNLDEVKFFAAGDGTDNNFSSIKSDYSTELNKDTSGNYIVGVNTTKSFFLYPSGVINYKDSSGVTKSIIIEKTNAFSSDSKINDYIKKYVEPTPTTAYDKNLIFTKTDGSQVEYFAKEESVAPYSMTVKANKDSDIKTLTTVLVTVRNSELAMTNFEMFLKKNDGNTNENIFTNETKIFPGNVVPFVHSGTDNYIFYIKATYKLREELHKSLEELVLTNVTSFTLLKEVTENNKTVAIYEVTVNRLREDSEISISATSNTTKLLSQSFTLKTTAPIEEVVYKTASGKGDTADNPEVLTMTNVGNNVQGSAQVVIGATFYTDKTNLVQKQSVSGLKSTFTVESLLEDGSYAIVPEFSKYINLSFDGNAYSLKLTTNSYTFNKLRITITFTESYKELSFNSGNKWTAKDITNQFYQKVYVSIQTEIFSAKIVTNGKDPSEMDIAVGETFSTPIIQVEIPKLEFNDENNKNYTAPKSIVYAFKTNVGDTLSSDYITDNGLKLITSDNFNYIIQINKTAAKPTNVLIYLVATVNGNVVSSNQVTLNIYTTTAGIVFKNYPTDAVTNPENPNETYKYTNDSKNLEIQKFDFRAMDLTLKIGNLWDDSAAEDISNYDVYYTDLKNVDDSGTQNNIWLDKASKTINFANDIDPLIKSFSFTVLVKAKGHDEINSQIDAVVYLSNIVKSIDIIKDIPYQTNPKTESDINLTLVKGFTLDLSQYIKTSGTITDDAWNSKFTLSENSENVSIIGTKIKADKVTAGTSSVVTITAAKHGTETGEAKTRNVNVTVIEPSVSGVSIGGKTDDTANINILSGNNPSIKLNFTINYAGKSGTMPEIAIKSSLKYGFDKDSIDIVAKQGNSIVSNIFEFSLTELSNNEFECIITLKTDSLKDFTGDLLSNYTFEIKYKIDEIEFVSLDSALKLSFKAETVDDMDSSGLLHNKDLKIVPADTVYLAENAYSTDVSNTDSNLSLLDSSAVDALIAKFGTKNVKITYVLYHQEGMPNVTISADGKLSFKAVTALGNVYLYANVAIFGKNINPLKNGILEFNADGKPIDNRVCSLKLTSIGEFAVKYYITDTQNGGFDASKVQNSQGESVIDIGYSSYANQKVVYLVIDYTKANYELIASNFVPVIKGAMLTEFKNADGLAVEGIDIANKYYYKAYVIGKESFDTSSNSSSATLSGQIKTPSEIIYIKPEKEINLIFSAVGMGANSVNFGGDVNLEAFGMGEISETSKAIKPTPNFAEHFKGDYSVTYSPLNATKIGTISQLVDSYGFVSLDYNTLNELRVTSLKPVDSAQCGGKIEIYVTLTITSGIYKGETQTAIINVSVENYAKPKVIGSDNIIEKKGAETISINLYDNLALNNGKSDYFSVEDIAKSYLPKDIDKETDGYKKYFSINITGVDPTAYSNSAYYIKDGENVIGLKDIPSSVKRIILTVQFTHKTGPWQGNSESAKIFIFNKESASLEVKLDGADVSALSGTLNATVGSKLEFKLIFNPAFGSINDASPVKLEYATAFSTPENLGYMSANNQFIIANGTSGGVVTVNATATITDENHVFYGIEGVDKISAVYKFNVNTLKLLADPVNKITKDTITLTPGVGKTLNSIVQTELYTGSKITASNVTTEFSLISNDLYNSFITLKDGVLLAANGCNFTDENMDFEEVVKVTSTAGGVVYTNYVNVSIENKAQPQFEKSANWKNEVNAKNDILTDLENGTLADSKYTAKINMSDTITYSVTENHSYDIKDLTYVVVGNENNSVSIFKNADSSITIKALNAGNIQITVNAFVYGKSYEIGTIYFTIVSQTKAFTISAPATTIVEDSYSLVEINANGLAITKGQIKVTQGANSFKSIEASNGTNYVNVSEITNIEPFIINGIITLKMTTQNKDAFVENKDTVLISILYYTNASPYFSKFESTILYETVKKDTDFTVNYLDGNLFFSPTISDKLYVSLTSNKFKKSEFSAAFVATAENAQNGSISLVTNGVKTYYCVESLNSSEVVSGKIFANITLSNQYNPVTNEVITFAKSKNGEKDTIAFSPSLTVDVTEVADQNGNYIISSNITNAIDAAAWNDIETTISVLDGSNIADVTTVGGDIIVGGSTTIGLNSFKLRAKAGQYQGGKITLQISIKYVGANATYNNLSRAVTKTFTLAPNALPTLTVGTYDISGLNPQTVFEAGEQGKIKADISGALNGSVATFAYSLVDVNGDIVSSNKNAFIEFDPSAKTFNVLLNKSNSVQYIKVIATFNGGLYNGQTISKVVNVKTKAVEPPTYEVDEKTVTLEGKEAQQIVVEFTGGNPKILSEDIKATTYKFVDKFGTEITDVDDLAEIAKYISIDENGVITRYPNLQSKTFYLEVYTTIQDTHIFKDSTFTKILTLTTAATLYPEFEVILNGNQIETTLKDGETSVTVNITYEFVNTDLTTEQINESYLTIDSNGKITKIQTKDKKSFDVKVVAAINDANHPYNNKSFEKIISVSTDYLAPPEFSAVNNAAEKKIDTKLVGEFVGTTEFFISDKNGNQIVFNKVEGDLDGLDYYENDFIKLYEGGTYEFKILRRATTVYISAKFMVTKGLYIDPKGYTSTVEITVPAVDSSLVTLSVENAAITSEVIEKKNIITVPQIKTFANVKISDTEEKRIQLTANYNTTVILGSEIIEEIKTVGDSVQIKTKKVEKDTQISILLMSTVTSENFKGEMAHSLITITVKAEIKPTLADFITAQELDEITAKPTGFITVKVPVGDSYEGIVLAATTENDGLILSTNGFIKEPTAPIEPILDGEITYTTYKLAYTFSNDFSGNEIDALVNITATLKAEPFAGKTIDLSPLTIKLPQMKQKSSTFEKSEIIDEEKLTTTVNYELSLGTLEFALGEIIEGEQSSISYENCTVSLAFYSNLDEITTIYITDGVITKDANNYKWAYACENITDSENPIHDKLENVTRVMITITFNSSDLSEVGGLIENNPTSLTYKVEIALTTLAPNPPPTPEITL